MFSTLSLMRMSITAIWVVDFLSGGYKLERFLHKNQHTQRKLLNFEFWINGELSKIGHLFSNKKNSKNDFIKKNAHICILQ
jgi:hypothetical protein